MLMLPMIKLTFIFGIIPLNEVVEWKNYRETTSPRLLRSQCIALVMAKKLTTPNSFSQTTTHQTYWKWK